jgi:TIR domain
MANVFVSHRKFDAAAAERLALEIERAGHSVWFDEWNIGIGDSIVGRISQGLVGLHYLILCCSSSGMSDWVDREWMSTLARQLSGHNVRVIPVLLTGGAPPAILADVRFADLVADWDRGVQALLRGLR